MLILVIMAIFFLLAVFSPKIKLKNQKDPEIKSIKKEVHVYSGLNPDLFSEFLNTSDLMEDTIPVNTELASYYLYRAIDMMQTIGLSATGTVSYALEELNKLSISYGIRAETLILDQALYKGDSFRPIYLNELHDN